jgi:hypothetical protein
VRSRGADRLPAGGSRRSCMHAMPALQAGIHPKVVSQCLGHATIAITLDACSHAMPATQEQAASPIAGLVFAGKRQEYFPRLDRTE